MKLTLYIALMSTIYFTQGKDIYSIYQEIIVQNTPTKTLIIDSLMTINYYSIDKKDKLEFCSVVLYLNKPIYIERWDDGSLTLEQSYLLDLQIDTSAFKHCNKYYIETYNTEIDLTTLPNSFQSLSERFGIKLGDGLSAQGKGNLFTRLFTIGCSNKKALDLLTSLNPQDRLVGYLLYDEKRMLININALNSVKESTYCYDFAQYCTTRTSGTPKQLKKELY